MPPLETPLKFCDLEELYHFPRSLHRSRRIFLDLSMKKIERKRWKGRFKCMLSSVCCMLIAPAPEANICAGFSAVIIIPGKQSIIHKNLPVIGVFWPRALLTTAPPLLPRDLLLCDYLQWNAFDVVFNLEHFLSNRLFLYHTRGACHSE